MGKNMFDLTSKSSKSSNTTGYRKSISPKKSSPTQQKTKNSKENQKITHTYSREEIKKLLVDYDELPRENWGTLQKNDQIRYTRLEGNVFRRGGFVIGQFINPQTKKHVIQLIANPYVAEGPTNKPWIISYDDIKTIWKKRPKLVKVSHVASSHTAKQREIRETSETDPASEDEEEQLARTAITTTPISPRSTSAYNIQGQVHVGVDNALVELMRQQIEQLKVEVVRLSNDQKDIIALIKRLHHIK
jgi:hypothetical protein